MRTECIRAAEELALSDPQVVIVGSDSGAGFMGELAEKHPERLMIEGVCEQALVGMAAGLSSEGYYPIIIMITVFATRRCYEQLVLDFGLHRFSGCVVGVGSGFNYAALGPTHIGVDDMTLVTSIPGSAVIAPSEPDEAILLLKQARAYRGLSYMRLAATTEALQNPRGDITFGKGRVLEWQGPVLFISCGAATLVVESARAILKESGIQAASLHIHTVKPLDSELVRRCARAAKVILCVEEHRQTGGLSSAVLHALTSGDSLVMPQRFASIGVDDTFPAGYGSYEDLLEHYGISATALAERARVMLSETHT